MEHRLDVPVSFGAPVASFQADEGAEGGDVLVVAIAEMGAVAAVGDDRVRLGDDAAEDIVTVLQDPVAVGEGVALAEIEPRILPFPDGIDIFLVKVLEQIEFRESGRFRAGGEMVEVEQGDPGLVRSQECAAVGE